MGHFSIKKISLQLIVGWVLFVITSAAFAHSEFDGASNTLTIPAVKVGNNFYWNVKVKMGVVVMVGKAPATTNYDTYDSTSKLLTMPKVMVGSREYNNVVVTIGDILEASGGDVSASALLASSNRLASYETSSTVLDLPAVSVGTKIYLDAKVKVTSVVNHGQRDVASSVNFLTADNKIYIPLVIVGNKAYYNAVVEMGPVVSMGSQSSSSTQDQLSSATISASKPSVLLGGSLSITWASVGASACTASGDWSGTKATSGATLITPTRTGTLTYNLSCSGSNITVNAKSSTVTVDNYPAKNLDDTVAVVIQGAAVPGSPVASVQAASRSSVFPTKNSKFMIGQVATFSVAGTLSGQGIDNLPLGIRVNVEDCVADTKEFPNNKRNGVHSCVLQSGGRKAGVVTDSERRILYNFFVEVNGDSGPGIRNNTLIFTFGSASASTGVAASVPSFLDGKLDSVGKSVYTFGPPTVTLTGTDKNTYETFGVIATAYPSSEGGKPYQLSNLYLSSSGSLQIYFGVYRDLRSGKEIITGFSIDDDSAAGRAAGVEPNKLFFNDAGALNTSSNPQDGNSSRYNSSFNADPYSTNKCETGLLFTTPKIAGPGYLARCIDMGVTLDSSSGTLDFGGLLKYYSVKNIPQTAPPNFINEGKSFLRTLTDGPPVGTVFVQGGLSFMPLIAEVINKFNADKLAAAKAAADAAAAKAAAEKAAAAAAAAAKAAADAAAAKGSYSCELLDSSMSYPACSTYVGSNSGRSCPMGNPIAACPTSNVLGICSYPAGSTITWYKSSPMWWPGGVAENDVKSGCYNGQGTWTR